MYPGAHAKARAAEPVIIMGRSGEAVTFADYEARANRLAHWLQRFGLKPLDHFAVFMENHPRFLECGAAGARSGLYYTYVNCYLTAEELAYILDDSESQVVFTSASRLQTTLAAMKGAPRVRACVLVDGSGDGACVNYLDDAIEDCPPTPLPEERSGSAMFYSSGSTGRPKGILRPLPETPPDVLPPRLQLICHHWRIKLRQIALIPAPLYHIAPAAAAAFTIQAGGTVVVMEKFDPVEMLALIERHRVNWVQLVPTMMSRMLRLPEETRRRYDLSSLETVLHGAAPCPLPVKQAMIDWLGPIVQEYYSATESHGMVVCDSAQWLAHKGTVGKSVVGEIHILDDAFNELPDGEVGTVWFKSPNRIAYFHDPAKSAKANSPDGTMSNVGDVGYVDKEGFLYLTDRAAFMIISGGVNIYPQDARTF